MRRLAEPQSVLVAANLAQRPEAHPLLQAAINDVNQDLPSYEAVRRFAILPDDITVENGLLTPSLKVRRDVVETKYRALIEKLGLRK